MTNRNPTLRIDAVERDELDAAAALLGRGMADNPVHLAVYRGDDALRARHHGAMVRTLLRSSPSTRIDGVREEDGTLVGVAAAAPPGHCRPGPTARLRLLATAAPMGPGTLARLLEWQQGWAAHDPESAHVHLGPVSVDRHLRGQGIGGMLLERHVARLDAVGAVGYLETDRPEAVGFYRRFGYVVVDEAEVLGVPCWFMRRPAF